MIKFKKTVFFTAMTFFSYNSLKCISMNNQECRKTIDINRNESLFYAYSILINKCRVSWNNINDPYAKLCVPDVAKNINIKVFNLVSRCNCMKLVNVNLA